MVMSFMTALPARATTVVSLAPTSGYSGPSTTVDIGKTITFTLHVDSVTDLWSWDIALQWDPTVLSFVSATEGSMLKTGGSTIFLAAPATSSGTLPDCSDTQLYTPGQTGSGDLAVFTFTIIGYAASPGSLVQVTKQTFLTSASGNPAITGIAAISPGVVILTPPPAHGPTAVITAPLDAQYNFINDTVSLDGSQSTGGYDALGGGIRAITTYSWSISKGGSTLLSFTGSTGSYKPTSAGDYTFTLTVTAPDGSPGTSGYVATSTVSHVVHVVAHPSGPALDVYTDRGGNGPNVPSDAYGPQELITLHGYVTYNNVAVANKEVDFQLLDASGNTVAYMTAISNDQGIATTTFRMPWPNGPNPQSTFGTWTIKGNVDISQVTASDVCPFTFNYIVQITGVQTENTLNVAGVSFLRGGPVQTVVSFKNIRQVAITTVVAVTLYDEAGVPINAGYVTVTIPAQSTVSTGITLTLPAYAYVGTGSHACADIFNLLPANLGLPYCPEQSAQFTIHV